MPGAQTSGDVILQDPVRVGQHVVVHVHLVEGEIGQLFNVQLDSEKKLLIYYPKAMATF